MLWAAVPDGIELGIERWPDHGTSHATRRCAHVDLARRTVYA